MGTLVDFFVGFGEVVKSLFSFVIDSINDLIYVVTLLGKFIAEIPNMISWLPAGCIALVITLFGIVIIYKVIGREG